LPPAAPQPATGIDASKIESTLLAVIAEKTGYPAEMLELGMDMEADLGIDSIKRVEIFGAMTAAHPGSTGHQPAGTRRIAHPPTDRGVHRRKSRWNCSRRHACGSCGRNGSALQQNNMARTPLLHPLRRLLRTPRRHTVSINPGSKHTLLSVIAEKTGYPAEMLEMGMDMEADLGIDSIKRVEIFGAMTAAHPRGAGHQPAGTRRIAHPPANRVVHRWARQEQCRRWLAEKSNKRDNGGVSRLPVSQTYANREHTQMFPRSRR
jgi:acyl carrier protein